MADKFAAEIYIGGKVPRSKVPGLIEVINAEGVSLSWDGSRLKLPHPGNENKLSSLIDELRRIAAPNPVDSTLNKPDPKGRLWFCDSKARYGEFEFLEYYCVQNGIAFDRKSEAYDEYSPELVRFRPGMTAPDVMKTDSSGHSQIDADLVKPLLIAIKEMGETINSVGGFNSNDVLLDYRKIAVEVENLQPMMPVELLPLEPFEIVEG